jgi:hypothetical protein
MSAKEAKNKIIVEYGSQEKDLQIRKENDGVYFLDTKKHKAYFWDMESGLLIIAP